MEKGRMIRLILIPVVFGLLMTIIAKQFIKKAPASAEPAAVETVSVVAVASKEPIPARTKLTDAQLTVKQVPKSYVTGNEFAEVKEVAGQISEVVLAPGEVILKNRVVVEGRGTLPYQIPKGLRAITIKVDELTAVAGHPAPGDYVDVILILPPKEPERTEYSTRLMVENVPVLARGAGTGGPPGTPSSYTLAVKPEHMLEISLAEQTGLIKLALRPALTEPNVGSMMLRESMWRTR